jgi:hypothetical protein
MFEVRKTDAFKSWLDGLHDRQLSGGSLSD